MPKSRGRGLCRGRNLGAGGDADPPCLGRAGAGASPGHALGQDPVRDHLPRGGQAGDPRRHDPRRARVPDGRGCRRLWRLLRRDQGADGTSSARPASATRPCRNRASPARHRRGGGGHAAHRRADDGQFLPAGARPDHEHRRHHPAHVGRPVRRAAGDPHGDRRGQAAGGPAFAQPGRLVRAISRG
jgi:hypothetical protein